MFFMPPNASFQEEFQAGQSSGLNGATWYAENAGILGTALGTGGTFDYQRNGSMLYLQYANAANYGVGVYMAGAGYSLPQTISIARSFASIAGSTGNEGQRLSETVAGWSAANQGAFGVMK